MGKIQVTTRIAIDEAELDERFIQSAGPGGQNVNKVATAVQLRFDVANSPSLPERVRARLAEIAGGRMTQDGVLILTAREHRGQDRNRAEARARLFDLIRRAAAPPPPPRRPTKPTLGSKRRRLEGKRTRGAVKQGRAKPSVD